jgi:hypothetical protein
VLNLNKSNRWVGVTNEIGVQLIEIYRAGSKAFLTREENEEYASHTIARHKKIRFESKIAKQIYAFGKYKKLSRAMIPIINDGYYLLLIFDARATEFDDVIMKKVVPLTEKERHRFIVIDDAGGG